MRRRCEDTLRGRSAPSPPAPDQRGIAAGLSVAATLIGLIVSQPAIAAMCRVPADVLCGGCVERLSIRVTPGGGCRISFIAPAADAAAGGAKFVDINVEAEPRRVRRRTDAPRLSVAKPEAPLRPSAGCFVFNGRRFCE